MFPELALRILSSTSPRCIGKFLWNFGVKGIVSIERFKRRMKKGEFFPPFFTSPSSIAATSAAKAAGSTSLRTPTQFQPDDIHYILDELQTLLNHERSAQ